MLFRTRARVLIWTVWQPDAVPQPSHPPLSRPPDFSHFWAATLEELERVPPAVERRRERAEHGVLLERLAFDSLGGARIHGYLLRKQGGGPRPLVFHGHGYGAQVEPQWEWAAVGLNVCGVDVRGQGKSRDAVPAPSPWGYVLTGIEAPEKHVLRGAVCDYLRGARTARELLGAAAERTVLHGFSFAGGLAILAEAFGRLADLLVLVQPSFGWAEGRRFLAQAGSGAEINRFLERQPEHSAEDPLVVMRYFDPASAADLIRCPTLVGVGEEDATVPAQTVLAIATRLAGPHELMRFPVSHTGTEEERRAWARFEQRWHALALSDVPADFGRRRG
jgi:cephalosporin-C deacetylase